MAGNLAKFGFLQCLTLTHPIFEVCVELHHDSFGSLILNAPEAGDRSLRSCSFKQIGKSSNFFPIRVGL